MKDIDWQSDRVFARYRLDPRMPNYGHDSLRQELVAAEHRQGLLNIPDELIEEYVVHAITTLGGVDDFKHYLPRLLRYLRDAYACNGRGSLWSELVFARAHYGACAQWPAKELQALSADLSDIFTVLLELDEGNATPDTVRLYTFASDARMCPVQDGLGVWRRFCAFVRTPRSTRAWVANVAALILGEGDFDVLTEVEDRVAFAVLLLDGMEEYGFEEERVGVDVWLSGLW